MNTPTEQSKRKPVLGCIADDVTGATDLAINLVQGGMHVVQIPGVPDAQILSQTDDVDAIVVALKTRSICKEDAVAQSLAALRSLQQCGVKRFYFKYCSTFDSTDEGNIGPVAEALIDALDVRQTIFCPAFPRAGRTVYQGHLFVGDKLLCESGMENHPLNPMKDANLVRVLSKQSTVQVGLLSCDIINQSVTACDERMAGLANDGVPFVIADTCHDSHLDTLARSVEPMPLITGGSGLARYLPDAWRASGLLESATFTPRMPSVTGRDLIVAGSCSLATNAQVKWMQGKCATWQVDVASVVADAALELSKVIAWASANEAEQTLMVSSTSTPEIVAELQDRFSTRTVALAVEQFLAAVAKCLVKDQGVRRLVLAGGETSGAVVRELGIGALQIGPEICVGVPWTETIGSQPQLAVALKSGNFGDEEFFAKALEMLP